MNARLKGSKPLSAQNKNYIRDLLIGGLSSITSLAVAYFMFQGQLKQSDADMVQTLYKQVQYLQERMAQQQETMQEKLFAQQAQIVSLKLQLSEKYEHTSILKEYLDAMPYPAWIKVADTTDNGVIKVITNWHINDAYEKFFGITNEFYNGKTDFEVWPNEVARQFFANDTAVLLRLTNKCKSETFPNKVFDGTKDLTGYVCKWPLQVEGRPAIAGQVLLPDIKK